MLVLLNPKNALTFYYWVVSIWLLGKVFVGDVNLDRFQRWLWSTPPEQAQMLREQPALRTEIEAMFAEYQHDMDMQYQVSVLRREMLTLPTLPEEGY
jgi:hypothetical protein